MPPTSPDAVAEDTLVTRPDLGDNAFTLVVKGDRIPAGLESNKRKPAGHRWTYPCGRSANGKTPATWSRQCRATVNIEGDGTVTYRLDGPEIDRDEPRHLRAYPSPGALLGLSPIAYASEAIGLGLAAQKYGARTSATAAHPAAT